MVDASGVPAGVRRVSLPGLSACAGAATGRLQVIDDLNGHDRVSPNAIVVVPQTNHNWNAAFFKIRGIVTECGNLMSHAATTSRECNIPALVEVHGAVERLKALDGQTVTLDARQGLLFAAAMPIVEVDMPITLWRQGDELDRLAETERLESTRQEKTGLWERLQATGQTLENSLGRWLGKPRKRYGYFQLDYYRRAWQRLPGYLNALFPEKPPITTPIEVEVIDRVLCVPVVEGQACFAPLMHHLTLADFEKLLHSRAELFDRCGAALANLEALEAGNVEQVVEGLVGAMMCMHLAFAFHSQFERRCLQAQLRHIAADQQAALIELAFWSDTGVADRRCILHDKHVALAALVESTRADPLATEILAQASLSLVRLDLMKHRPALWKRIRGLSELYKHGSEDLRQPSDDIAYLEDIQHQLQGGRVLGLTQLAAYCQPYTHRDQPGQPGEIAVAIQRKQPDLYALLAAHAARSRGDSAEAGVTAILEELLEQVRGGQVVRSILKRYPLLRRTLSLSKQESLLREDAHQLICRWQRRLVTQMRLIGHRAVAVGLLQEADQVFDLGTAELVALVRSEANVRCLRLTPQRQRLWEQAEKALEENGGLSGKGSVEARRLQRESALSRYRADLRAVLGLLRQQQTEARAAGNPELQSYYQEESDRLHRRMCRLQDQAYGLPAYPPLV